MLLLMGVWLSGCTSIDDNFPVPEASTVPKFSAEVLDEETREVKFNNESIVPEIAGNVTYNWAFGDGSSSTEESPTHIYDAFGEYEVKLVILVPEQSQIVETANPLALLQPINIDFTLFYMDADLLAIEAVGLTTNTIGLNGFGGGLALDKQAGVLYYSDDDNLQIKRVSKDGSDPEILFEGLTAVGNIALDVPNGKVYWTNRSEGAVYRGNMDGSGSAEQIINTLELPEGIAVSGDKIYISDVQAPPIGENIYEADLNGANLEIFLGGSWGYGLAVDEANGRLYFGDQGVFDNPNDNRLKSVSLINTSDVQTVANLEAIGDNGSRTYGIAINTVENKVYWSDRNSDKIKSANLDGSELSTILVAEGQPRGIALDF